MAVLKRSVPPELYAQRNRLHITFCSRCPDDDDADVGNMRPLPPGQDGVDYCKIRRDRNHHGHHGVAGGTLRRSSASSAALLEPPSPAERYHGTVEGHYRVHDLALDRYVPPPSPERYSSGATSSAGRSYNHHQHQHYHHHHHHHHHHNHNHHQQQLSDDRYSGGSGSGGNGNGNGGGGGGRNHYLPVSQSASESFMSPPSPVAERFDYAARHHDSYATAAKRNEPVYSR